MINHRLTRMAAVAVLLSGVPMLAQAQQPSAASIAYAKEIMAREGKESAEYQAFRKENVAIIEFADTIEKAEKRLRKINAAENAAERGATRANGVNPRDRKAILKGSGILVPSGRKLTKEEVAKVKEKTREAKASLAQEFNDKYLAEVMATGE